MVAPDSSVLVAGADPGHPGHEPARRALTAVRSDGCLIAHTIAETYATLTRPVFAKRGAAVVRYLGQFLRRQPIGLRPDRYQQAVDELADAGVVGLSVHDGLIAIAARDAGVRLLSLDHRARRAYAAVHTDFELLEQS